jgi:CubicO group peptidase (beta-lactamase class C family)
MSASHASIPGSKESYGYGLEIGDWRGVRILHHGGSRAGYGSEIRMDPRERVGVIVQTNRTGGTLPETMERAFEMLVPLGSQESVKKKSVVPLSSEDLEQNAGNFQNGDERIEIVARDRQLYLKRPGASEVQMLKTATRNTALREAADPSSCYAAAMPGRSSCRPGSALTRECISYSAVFEEDVRILVGTALRFRSLRELTERLEGRL